MFARNNKKQNQNVEGKNATKIHQKKVFNGQHCNIAKENRNTQKCGPYNTPTNEILE